MDKEESFSISSSSIWYFPLVSFFLYFLHEKALLARYNSTFRMMFIVNLNLLHLFHSDIDITGTDHSEVSLNSDSSSNSSATESSAESEDDNCFL